MAFLVFALLVAAVFAWLGKWQVERAIIQGAKDSYDTEVAVALADIADPAQPLVVEAAGRRVTVDATLDRSSLVVVGNRVHGDQTGDQTGCWVTGRLVTSDGALAVALGWAATLTECETIRDEQAATISLEALTSWTGRYSPPETPETPSGNTTGIDPLQLNYMSVAALFNMWPGSEGPVYAGYLVLEPAPAQKIAGLEQIASTPPISDTSLNLLNVFYAIEWVVFACGAVFLWWRLLRDDFERRTEEDE